MNSKRNTLKKKSKSRGKIDTIEKLDEHASTRAKIDSLRAHIERIEKHLNLS